MTDDTPLEDDDPEEDPRAWPGPPDRHEEERNREQFEEPLRRQEADEDDGKTDLDFDNP